MTVNTDTEVQLPFGPPPVLPDVIVQLREYIQCPERLPIHDYEKAQKFWPRTPKINSLYFSELSPLATTLKVSRDYTTGEIIEYYEVPNLFETNKSKKQPTSNKEGAEPEQQSAVLKNTQIDVNFEKDLLSIAPGLFDGIEFGPDGFTPFNDEAKPTSFKSKKKNARNQQEKSTADQQNQVVSLKNLLHQEQDIMELIKGPVIEKEVPKKTETQSPHIIKLTLSQDEEAVVPKETFLPVLKISQAVTKKPVGKVEWAEEIDVSQPVEDFEKKIPDPAFTWNFELDNFQKQAILKLEDGQNVFVSAHTSAGKTVVAEYAIALSLKQHTRAIYTSPIKALSNQKYRDFKNVFEYEHKLGDVGLITGDVQLNPKAGCLIMTTEILRSMLYKKNEVIRDLEYVIFDEVHYINDKERGHVWEEVVILLPPHVKIVMLSATVPNTLEFANWVGRTKGNKKMYVISTVKRPVPLQHFLYTGMDHNSRNQCFLIRDAEGPFLKQGHIEACMAKEERKKKEVEGSDNRGGRGRGGRGRGGRGGYGRDLYRPNTGRVMLTEKQEKNMFESLMKYLSEEENLPVVLFTLSRNRCDKNAEMLMSSVKNLTDDVEKNYIKTFFQKNISRLKEEDRQLPQILKLKCLLMQGIGIHHSGILPILKEIVELLFQEGKVKLLFATETFAMGVNMPARTVVFDSVVKFDGLNMRTLLPAEYIQMAGRAGRRGKDKTGKVIILCKTDVPDEKRLKTMMFDQPMPLISQFRTTYSMILKNLKRSSEADISVETMMTSSFKEFYEQTRHSKYRIELAKLTSEYEMEKTRHGVKKPGEEILENFYHFAEMYIEKRRLLWNKIISIPKLKRELIPGRVIHICKGIHINKLGIILLEEKTHFLTLVLHNQSDNMNEIKDDLYLQMAAILNRSHFIWDGYGGHQMLQIVPEDIIDITTFFKKNLDVNTILRDWEQRQHPRFRNAEMGPTFKDLLCELSTLTANFLPNFMGASINNLVGNVLEVYDLRADVQYWWNKLETCGAYNIPNRNHLFYDVYRLKHKEEELNKLKFKLSSKSMSLYPDFEKKLVVLQDLKYIDPMNTVEIKGKVAIIMGSNELMITELMFRNILKDMLPAQIAALLSGLVFQAKTKIEPKVDCLEAGKKEIEAVYKDILAREKECGVDPENMGEFALNFGLMEVVYKWALNEKFSEIMKLTDVQEGIIVRCIQQLSELLRYVKEAANSLGDPTLGNKMDEVIEAIKRDIVFAASLYTTEKI